MPTRPQEIFDPSDTENWPNQDLPSRRMYQLYQQLMPYYGLGVEDMGLPGPVGDAGEIGAMLTPDDDDSGLADGMGFAMEAFKNQSAAQRANEEYDSRQPYGFDFRKYKESALGNIRETADFAANALRGRGTVDTDGEIISFGPGDNVDVGTGNLPAPIEEDPLKTMFAQLLRTGGSMAMPMLMGALMRGGK